MFSSRGQVAPVDRSSPCPCPRTLRPCPCLWTLSAWQHHWLQLSIGQIILTENTTVCGMHTETMYCDSEPCLNGGICEDDRAGNTYSCTCCPAFVGQNCDTVFGFKTNDVEICDPGRKSCFYTRGEVSTYTSDLFNFLLSPPRPGNSDLNISPHLAYLINWLNWIELSYWLRFI